MLVNHRESRRLQRTDIATMLSASSAQHAAACWILRTCSLRPTLWPDFGAQNWGVVISIKSGPSLTREELHDAQLAPLFRAVD